MEVAKETPIYVWPQLNISSTIVFASTDAPRKPGNVNPTT